MSLLAMIGFVFGGLAAAGWFIAANQLLRGTKPVQPRDKAPAETPKQLAAPAAAKQPPAALPQQPPAVSLIEKPPIVRLQEADVMRTLGGILATDSTADVTQLGWPTLRAGFPLMTVLNSLREMRAVLTRRAGDENLPVVAVIGAGPDQDRSIAALNMALAAARDGAKVLLIDADLKQRALSSKVSHFANSEPSRFGWLNIGTKAARAIPTANGISILRAVNAGDAKAGDAIRKAIAQARSAGDYDLVVIDGPAMPWSPADRKLLDLTDGLVPILPVHLDINDSMEDIIAALGGTERKLVGVVLSEVNPTAVNPQRDKQYA
jgi:Mrp family chromosome partitioning ATPase